MKSKRSTVSARQYRLDTIFITLVAVSMDLSLDQETATVLARAKGVLSGSTERFCHARTPTVTMRP